jgi:hypothetical protein
MGAKNSACHPSAMMHGLRIFKPQRNRLAFGADVLAGGCSNDVMFAGG